MASLILRDTKIKLFLHFDKFAASVEQQFRNKTNFIFESVDC